MKLPARATTVPSPSPRRGTRCFADKTPSDRGTRLRFMNREETTINALGTRSRGRFVKVPSNSSGRLTSRD